MGKEREKTKKKKKQRRRMTSCCEREGLRRGAWSVEEDKLLVDFITENGHGTWRNLPKLAGLLRCGKSCRLRWTNYLRPDIKRGPFSPEEENTIIQLHETLGNKWAAIASHLSARTDNDVKNFWNSHLRKRFSNNTPNQPSESSKTNPKSPITRHMAQWESVRVEAESRLSTKPFPLNPPPPAIPPQGGDYFVSLWNSKVGQSFRTVSEFNPQSPTSQTSSLTKVESCKTGSPEMIWECKKESEDVGAYPDISNSYDLMDDSSDAMMKLLLDFPLGDDDLGFLQETVNDVSNYV